MEPDQAFLDHTRRLPWEGFERGFASMRLLRDRIARATGSPARFAFTTATHAMTRLLDAGERFTGQIGRDGAIASTIAPSWIDSIDVPESVRR